MFLGEHGILWGQQLKPLDHYRLLVAQHLPPLHVPQGSASGLGRVCTQNWALPSHFSAEVTPHLWALIFSVQQVYRLLFEVRLLCMAMACP